MGTMGGINSVLICFVLTCITVLTPEMKSRNRNNNAIQDILVLFSVPFKIYSQIFEVVPYSIFIGILTTSVSHSIYVGFQPILRIYMLL